MKKIKIAYIGGGSKQWARVFMNDLALAEGIDGEIGLYDIDREAAVRNQKIGERINRHPDTVSKFAYVVYDRPEDVLKDADFVVMSILPGTFEEMRSDVHVPERYGIFQSVGDTAGPGGVLRAMRTVPIYQEYAAKIQEICPNAWVINFTNPMSICVKALYDTFPGIKAFGCCHEVFHTQDFLCCVLAEELGIEKPDRKEIYTDVSGINHFTWITKAQYGDVDILKLLPGFIEKHYEEGFYEHGDKNQYRTDTFAYANRVKMNMYRTFGALGAAGDRHLVEFMNSKWYLADQKTIDYWKFALTTVEFRVKQMEERIAESIALAEGSKAVEVKKSDEEAVELMKALLGFETRVSNVNMPNCGQMKDMPLGAIVETNAVFSNNSVSPVTAASLPTAAKNLVLRGLYNIEDCYEGIKERDFGRIFTSFVNQPLCADLSKEQAYELFSDMVVNTRKYLNGYYDVDGELARVKKQVL